MARSADLRCINLSAPRCVSSLPTLWSARACRRRTLSSATSRNDNVSSSASRPGGGFSLLPWPLLRDQSTAMFAAGSVLGPFCDSQHSASNVLHYANPTITSLGPMQMETCWWVPLLFGVAGLILGVSYPVLDVLVQEHELGLTEIRAKPEFSAPRGGTRGIHGTHGDGAATTQATLNAPSWGTVLLAISLFVAQYKLSAVLEQPLLGYPAGVEDAVLLLYGVAVWKALDGSAVGLAMSCLTAAAGPAVEIVLINGLGLYTYSHPQFLGIPSWIPCVYFCGGPAVGLLGRRVWATLSLKHAKTEPPIS